MPPADATASADEVAIARVTKALGRIAELAHDVRDGKRCLSGVVDNKTAIEFAFEDLDDTLAAFHRLLTGRADRADAEAALADQAFDDTVRPDPDRGGRFDYLAAIGAVRSF